MWRVFEYLGLALAFALIIAGTAIMWNVRGELIPNNSLETRNQYNWDGATFWVAWFLACTAVFFRSTMLAALAAGMTVAFSIYYINNLFSWPSINRCRRYDQFSDTNGSWSRRCTAGGILHYTGIILALFIAFSPYGWMASPSVLPRLLWFAALVLGITGLVMIWASEAVDVNSTAYTQTLDATVLGVLSLFYTWAGTFGYNVPLRACAGFLSAFSFVLIFHFMFDAHLAVQNSGPEAQVYAGFIILWIAMMICMAISVLLFYGQSFSSSRMTGTGSDTGAHGQPTTGAATSTSNPHPHTATV